MSHFNVAVFSDGRKTVEELLAPYQENNMEDCPKEYLQFVSSTEEERDRYENDSSERIVLGDGEMLYTWDDERLKEKLTYTEFHDGKDHSNYFMKPDYYCRTSGGIGNKKDQTVYHLTECGAEFKTIPFKDIYPTLEYFVKDYIEAQFDEEMQDYGYWVNPNAKWDYWQIGGRWKGFLRAKEGENGETSLVAPIPNEKGKYAQARVRNINFEPDTELYQKNLRWWEVVVEDSTLQPGEDKKDFFNFYKKEYLIAKYKKKELYAKIRSSVITYAVITPDGKWYQKGDMGWFGLSSETPDASFEWDMKFKENFIDKADPDWVLTIVDCHI